MKSFNVLKMVFAFSTIIFTTSCSKDSEPPPVNLGSTTWQDSALINGIKYKPFMLKFNDDGTGEVTLSGYSPFKGFWNKLPASPTVNFYFTESATATWKGQGTLSNTNSKLENGVLTRLTPSTISGTFVATKQ